MNKEVYFNCHSIVLSRDVTDQQLEVTVSFFSIKQSMEANQ